MWGGEGWKGEGRSGAVAHLRLTEEGTAVIPKLGRRWEGRGVRGGAEVRDGEEGVLRAGFYNRSKGGGSSGGCGAGGVRAVR